jgi:hypothetical protein
LCNIAFLVLILSPEVAYNISVFTDTRCLMGVRRSLSIVGCNTHILKCSDSILSSSTTPTSGMENMMAWRNRVNTRKKDRLTV